MDTKIDWSLYKFHPSGLADIMTNSRKKDDLLSETAKSALREIYIKEVYGREKPDAIGNKYTQKGIMCETDSINLVQEVTGAVYFKNQKTYENDYLVGTPDIVTPRLVDIKTPWDIFTFSAVDQDKATKDYYYQLLGYMYLLDRQEADIIYALVDTPEEMVTDEMYRLSFKMPEDQIDKYRHNYAYSDIPSEQRIKKYTFTRDDAKIIDMKLRIECAREYLSKLTL